MTFSFKKMMGCADKIIGVPARIKCLTKVLILFAVLFGHPVFTFGAPPPAPYSLTFAWNSGSNPNVVGYHLYYGTASRNYTSNIVLGNVTNIVVSGLSGGNYYFAIAAYDANGLESALSPEISYQQNIAGPLMQSLGLSGGQFTLTVTGPTGQTYDIQATQDFTTWTVVGTVTLDASGSQGFTDINAADFPQRFYRAEAQP
jgi:hypothetical protein